MRPWLMVFTLLVFTADSAQALGLLRRMNWASTSENHEISPDCSALPARSELVVSFIAPPGVRRLEEMQADIVLKSGSSAVPSWWYFAPFTGGCRADSLSVSTDLSGTSHQHPTAWSGLPSIFFSFTPYTTGSDLNAGNISIHITAAPGDTIALDPFEEYDAFRVVFGNPETGCGGCETPTCFVVGRLTIQHDGKTEFTEDDGFTDYCRWEPGQLSCPFAVPTRSTTWGQLKAQYR